MGFIWHVFDRTREDSRPKILLSKSVPISLLTHPEHSQPNKNALTLALAMQFTEVAGNMLVFRFGERNMQFFRAV